MIRQFPFVCGILPLQLRFDQSKAKGKGEIGIKFCLKFSDQPPILILLARASVHHTAGDSCVKNRQRVHCQDQLIVFGESDNLLGDHKLTLEGLVKLDETVDSKVRVRLRKRQIGVQNMCTTRLPWDGKDVCHCQAAPMPWTRLLRLALRVRNPSYNSNESSMQCHTAISYSPPYLFCRSLVPASLLLQPQLHWSEAKCPSSVDCSS